MANFYLFCLLAAAACVTGSIVKTNNKNSSTFELLILHNNDMHARFEQTSQLSGACTIADRDAGKCYGGFPRVAHVVKEARRAASVGEGPPVLYLNAGDTYTGTAWFTIYKWKIAAEFINALQPDAVALGNNEIDVNTHKLSPFIENIKPPILASNVIINSVEETRKIEKSIIFDIDGTKVGVVGYLKLDASALDTAGTIEYVDEVIAIREEVETLKSQGINIIIALGHSDDAKDMDIAREVDGIDLVISGHKNIFFWNGTSHDAEKSESYEAVVVTQTSGKQVPVVHSYTYSKYLGYLSVKFDVYGEISSYDVRPILLDETISQNSDVVSVVENADVQVGTTSVVLDGDSCNVAECNFGNLVTDAMMYIYAINFEGDNWTDAPVAIIPAGSITASIAPLNRPAAVYETDLLKALSLESSVVAVTMSGTVLEQVLEQAVADFDPSDDNNQFLQFSGIRVTYDFSLPSGSRVTRAIVRCWSCFVPEFFTIDSWRDYKVLMPLALANGGYGYSMLTSLPRENVEFDEVTSVTKYMELRSPVYPEVAGRIRLLNVPEVEPEPTTPEVSPETEPPVTEPPVTEPPVTEAPVPGAATTLTTTITLFIVYLLTLVIM